MTPEQERYIKILEDAGQAALRPATTGVFVAVASIDGEMHVKWEGENGLYRLALIGLLEVGLQTMKKQALENFGGEPARPGGPVLRIVPPEG